MQRDLSDHLPEDVIGMVKDASFEEKTHFVEFGTFYMHTRNKAAVHRLM